MKKRVVWVPYKGSSKYPEKKPRRLIGSFVSLLAFCLFWIGNHFAYLIMKVFVSNTWIFSEWLNPNSICHLFLWYIAIPSYRDWTNPNTILQFILLIIFIVRYFDDPWELFHIEVSWFLLSCVRWVHMRKFRWTGLTKLWIASLIRGSEFVIIEHERDVKKKGIRIMCFY